MQKQEVSDAKEDEERQRRDEARWESLTRKIEKQEGATRDLDALERVGVPRKELLKLLAGTVDALKNPGNNCAEELPDKLGKLRRLAEQLEAWASEMDKAISDPLLSMQWWLFFYGYGRLLGMKPPQPWKRDPGVQFTVDGMRVLSKMFKLEAKKFGQFLRVYARKNAQAPIALLLLFVFFNRTGRGRARKWNHFSELARLLSDAIEVAEIDKYGRPRSLSREKDKYFSAHSLEKVWKRQGKDLLGWWAKLNLPAPKSPPQVPLSPYSPPR